MAAPRTMPERDAIRGARARRVHGSGGVLRRAPLSENPRVGARGQRTQQRILDSALGVFAERGYHRASVDRIAKLAGCSRGSFYQYFASKEDVFGHLSGQVARQLSASTEALAPVTVDADGWQALRAWVARYAEIHARYEAVFSAYETDDVLARVAARTGADVLTLIQARLVATTLPPRQVDPVVRLLLQTLNHTLGIAGVLRTVVPVGYPSDRIEGVLTDVVHRTLFGRRADVNVHPPAGPPPPALEFGVAMRELLRRSDDDLGTDAASNRARAALLASARDVFVRHGYHTTRVDDLVAAAGVSHGAFYRYFRNKADLARVLTAQGLRAVGATLVEMPDGATLRSPSGRASLRRWLRGYHAAQSSEAAMSRVWLDAALQDPALRREVAPPWDWGRRRMARALVARGFGDADMDALVMVGLLGVFGAQERSASEVDAAADIVDRGLFGR